MDSESGVDSRSLHVVMVSLGLRGGMVQYVAALANALSTTVTVTVISPDSEEVQLLFSDSVDLRTITVLENSGPIRSRLVNLRAFALIQRHLRNVDADIVHVPFVGGIPSALTTIFACLHCPLVVGTIHDPKSHLGQEVDFLGLDLRELAVGIGAKLLDSIIVHGESSREQAEDMGYPMDKLTVLRHGLYTHFETSDGEDVRTDPTTLLFFGKMRPNKGFDRITTLLDQIAEDVPEVRAIVAGSPDVAPQIDDHSVDRVLSELRKHERVELHEEYIPNERVASYFRRAAVVVLPYYDATASGVAMIAYTFGTPMVATDTGNLGEMISRDDTGLLADPESTDEIADRIVEILERDELRAELRENVLSAREEYSWEQIGERTLDLYTDNIREGRLR